MPEFKWETLKERAVYIIYDNPLYKPNPNPAYYALLSSARKGIPWKTELANLQSESEKVIRSWDLRVYKRLIEIFPSILPKKYHNQTPIIYMNDKSEWVLSYP